MKCNEARNLVLTYLDSELDARTSQEIQLHLQSCEECARLFENEEKFNERLFAVLGAGQPTLALWEKVESRLRPETALGRLLHRSKPLTLAGLAVVLGVGLVAGIVKFLPRASSLDLAQAVEKDHRAALQGKMPPEFAGVLPDDVARKLGARLDAAAFRKVPATDRFRADGARLCHLDGVPVAWTLGHYGDVPVSWVVFKKSELDHFPKTRHRLESGEAIVCTRTGRFRFAVRLAGDHVVCAIAETSKQLLEDLVRSVTGPG